MSAGQPETASVRQGQAEKVRRSQQGRHHSGVSYRYQGDSATKTVRKCDSVKSGWDLLGRKGPDEDGHCTSDVCCSL